MTLKKLLDNHPEYKDLELAVYTADGSYFYPSDSNGGIYISKDEDVDVLVIDPL